MRSIVRVGVAVLVPFGRQTLTGIVTGEGEPLDRGNGTRKPILKPILDVLDEDPAITAEQLSLAEWISDYYVCGLGEALRAALPPGIGSASEQRVRRGAPCKQNEDTGPVTAAERTLLSFIPEAEDVSLRTLLNRVPSGTRAQLRKLQAGGLISIDLVVRGPRTKIRKQTIVHLRADRPDDWPRGIKQRAVIERLLCLAGESGATEAATDRDKKDDGITQTQLLKETGGSSATIRRLQELGFVRLSEREMDRSRWIATRGGGSDSRASPSPEFDLDETQTLAIEKIAGAIETGRFETFLLHGVTGSGKTEVYIEALKRARAIGKSGIILVPEISLTPQTVARFRAHFGEEIAVLHSRMSPGERFDAWRGIRAGLYPIVIGPRSAVLAPVQNLGLVVVDEEHEQSYKQFDPSPRYHARDVAVMRAMKNSAACVLGSATPSLESLLNARSGKFTLLTMPERVVVAGRRATLPAVRIVDMRKKATESTGSSIISQPLADAIQKRLGAKEQIILLQNRRGYAPVIRCEQCNWAPDCPDCSVSMTYHKARRHLRCHYCGRTRRLPTECPSCGYESILQLGVGTQRVEEELLACFPGVRVARMDLDTTTVKDAHYKILDRFSRGDADILLGTQMVSKGLDFGNVSLVGIIDADTGLHLPDIRAEERTFQLLTQVAGRAGRAELPGEVILQTRNPGHRVIQFAMQHDYERFSASVLPERSALDYPPFGRIVALLFTGPEENKVNRMAQDWCRVARSIDSSINILGPSPSYVGRVRRNHRAQILIKVEAGRSHKGVRAFIRQTRQSLGNPPRNYRIAVDVDPVGLM